MTSTKTLSVADIDTTHGEEPRILDTRIGERLGMAQPLDIRRTIEANREELERYGTVFAHRAKTSVKGGRPSIAYYLNEGQTLLLCMFSRTAKAADVREEVIRVFMAYRSGSVPVKAHTRRKPKKDDRIDVEARHQSARLMGRTAIAMYKFADIFKAHGEDEKAGEARKLAADYFAMTLMWLDLTQSGQDGQTPAPQLPAPGITFIMVIGASLVLVDHGTTDVMAGDRLVIFDPATRGLSVVVCDGQAVPVPPVASGTISLQAHDRFAPRGRNLTRADATVVGKVLTIDPLTMEEDAGERAVQRMQLASLTALLGEQQALPC